MPILATIAGFSSDTELVMYEEVKPNLIEKIEFTDGLLEKELDELMDGDILIVQKSEPNYLGYRKPTPKEYSRLLQCHTNNAVPIVTAIPIVTLNCFCR